MGFVLVCHRSRVRVMSKCWVPCEWEVSNALWVEGSSFPLPPLSLSTSLYSRVHRVASWNVLCRFLLTLLPGRSDTELWIRFRCDCYLFMVVWLWLWMCGCVSFLVILWRGNIIKFSNYRACWRCRFRQRTNPESCHLLNNVKIIYNFYGFK